MLDAGARVLLLKDHPERLLDGARVSIERMPAACDSRAHGIAML
jgi:hypothetical protein